MAGVNLELKDKISLAVSALTLIGVLGLAAASCDNPPYFDFSIGFGASPDQVLPQPSLSPLPVPLPLPTPVVDVPSLFTSVAKAATRVADKRVGGGASKKIVLVKGGDDCEEGYVLKETAEGDICVKVKEPPVKGVDGKDGKGTNPAFCPDDSDFPKLQPPKGVDYKTWCYCPDGEVQTDKKCSKPSDNGDSDESDMIYQLITSSKSFYPQGTIAHEVTQNEYRLNGEDVTPIPTPVPEPTIGDKQLESFGLVLEACEHTYSAELQAKCEQAQTTHFALFPSRG